MELKVWVEGVVRVVCGLSLNTSCQDVVIALAQSIGQTGRYVLILKLRGTERQLAAADCPLRRLAELGQLGAEVQFVLRRTGPSLSDGPDDPPRERRFPRPEPEHPEALRHPHKALSFSLGPLTHPKRTRTWSPSPRASPEPRVSSVPYPDPSKEEAFRHILQQQRRLQDLEVQLQALERETQGWERWSEPGPGPDRVSLEELEELERRYRQNEEDMKFRETWEEELQEEVKREQDLQRRLRLLASSLDDEDRRKEELQVRSAHLEQDVRLRVSRLSSLQREQEEQEEEALRPLEEELHLRLLQGEQLQEELKETRRETQNAEEKLQGRRELMEELNKELRHCKLQQFILQTGSPHPDHIRPGPEVYISNAGIME